MDQKRLEELNTQWRAANYLGAAQLYLKTNVLLREPLRPDDIKPRLLGHWGTQPGLNLVYSHLNRLIQDTDASVMLVVGPGHGAPGILAELWIDGSLGEFYPDMGRDMGGITRLVHQFSWPGGFPSHLTALAPGAINEGGELGYSLLHAFGAAFDNPELIVACIVGDGEAETGGLAASWFSNRFLNPASDGAVLPILHLNGIKLSGPSIMGRMSDEELEELFTGYGYEPRFVEGDDPLPVHQALWEAMDWAYQRIREIQAAVRESPTWPMIILKTLKGWTGPKELDGQPIEGTERSHQIPILDPADNPEHLRALEAWLTSYRPEELFDSSGKPAAEVTAVCPSGDKRMGMVPQANGGQLLVPLELPDLADYAVEVPEPGSVKAESTRELGKFLRDVFSRNRTNFRMVSPDETTSNRLDDVFDATHRVFMWPIKETDQHMSHQGKVMEALNEQMCEGWLEGYLLTGRHGLFPCYEAFVPIVDSMVGQYAKWLKIAREVPWRKPVASLNYLLTSHAWRQDHNGYSHQSPSFINTLLSKKNNVVRIYLPPDTNCLLTVFAHCLESRDYVNCVISSKQPMPQWLSIEEAREHCARGASCWEWAGNDDGRPDAVLAAAGDVPMHEILAAAWLLQKHAPDLRLRVVNVIDLFALETLRQHPHGLEDQAFVELFTEDAPVIFAFHGYPRVIHELIYRRPNPGRFHVRGYSEEGTTTTPFDMAVVNNMSRYQLAMETLKRVDRIRSEAGDIIDWFEGRLAEHRAYIVEHGDDMPEVKDWVWTPIPVRVPLPG